MNIKKVVFIRHGETKWNAEQRWQGHIDIPLSAKGISQAQKAAAKIKLQKPEILVSSDLTRAMQTAQIIAQVIRIPIQPLKEIREINLGTPEGLLMIEVLERFRPEWLEKWRSIDPSDLDFAFPNGETKRDGLQRCRNAIESFLMETPVNCAGFVFHGMIMRTLIHSLFPKLQEPVTIENCKYFILGFDVDNQEWLPYGELAELVNAA